MAVLTQQHKPMRQAPTAGEKRTKALNEVNPECPRLRPLTAAPAKPTLLPTHSHHAAVSHRFKAFQGISSSASSARTWRPAIRRFRFAKTLAALPGECCGGVLGLLGCSKCSNSGWPQPSRTVVESFCPLMLWGSFHSELPFAYITNGMLHLDAGQCLVTPTYCLQRPDRSYPVGASENSI